MYNITKFAYSMTHEDYFSPQHDLQLIFFEESYLASPGLAKARKKKNNRHMY